MFYRVSLGLLVLEALREHQELAPKVKRYETSTIHVVTL